MASAGTLPSKVFARSVLASKKVYESVMADNRPGDSDMHRRQRGKNLVVAGFLLVLAVIFFVLTIVRMGPHL